MTAEAGDGATGSGDAPRTTDRGPVSLVGRWQVEDIGNAGVLDGAPPTIEFRDDGSLIASAGLNRIRGGYKVVDGTLQTSPLMSTRMAGPPAVMHQERRLIEALETGGPIVERPPFVHIGDSATSLRLIRADDQPTADAPPG